MTNHWNDLANSDCILAIGCNPAENHPVSSRFIAAARDKGGKLISVDPRFTRTSSVADFYATIRSGADIAFIGGMIKYVLDDMEQFPGNYNMAYLIEYTDAPYLINPGFRCPADLDGLFSGYDGVRRSYDKSTWSYQADEKGVPKRDMTLTDPNCVFQLLKKQYARYTPDLVCSITGTPRETFLDICRTYSATGRIGKAGAIMYAMGATQHTNGTQIIRSYAILQLLLANIGVAGGGVNALRGESNVQGSTDHSLLYNLLPGYLAMPVSQDETLEGYLKRVTPFSNDPRSANWWQNTPQYMVSLLKAWYGDNAATGNEFGYQYLPKNGGDYSWLPLFDSMFAGGIKGLMCWGQNPAVSGPNSNMERQALENLDWLVAVDLWETETASFWKRPGTAPAEIKTEVFLLPAAASFEKQGSVTNSSRWSQWRYKCADPPGEARADLDIVNALMTRIRDLYRADEAPNREAILNLTWNYGDHPDPHQVAREINGYDLATGKLLAGFGQLSSSGATSSGNWLYCGSYTEMGNMAARRDLTPDPFDIGLHPNWAWCWPMDRRILYNRASVDLKGEPWDKQRPVIRWQGGQWVGDVPDGAWPPMEVDPEKSKLPFIMKAEGHAHLFGPSLADGPFPEHYEPWESPVINLMSGTQNDPAFKTWAGPMDFKGAPDAFPIVCTTYRVPEHWQAGQMTRNLPWNIELMPEMFVEIGQELALEKDIPNGGRVIVETARGRVEAVAVVTGRFKPFTINGGTIHQIGMPWHWGYGGLAAGDSANLLTPNVGDANTMIPEYKAFLCRVRKA